jgi:hypothetical protein
MAGMTTSRDGFLADVSGSVRDVYPIGRSGLARLLVGEAVVTETRGGVVRYRRRLPGAARPPAVPGPR